MSIMHIHPNGYHIYQHFFSNTGFSFLWLLQNPSEMASLPLGIIIKKISIFKIGLSTVNNSPKCVLYITSKHKFELEQHLFSLYLFLVLVILCMYL